MKHKKLGGGLIFVLIIVVSIFAFMYIARGIPLPGIGCIGNKKMVYTGIAPGSQPRCLSSTQLKYGQCPVGYIEYGVPLGCVSKDYYQWCQSGKAACPICLSNHTTISTNLGPKEVTGLRPGDLVWSVNNKGNKVLVPILKTISRPVAKNSKLVSIDLSDSRNILASGFHPTSDGRLFMDINLGDRLDNAEVTKITLANYNAGFTYDILPDSSTGYYWANNILVGSTLKH